MRGDGPTVTGDVEVVNPLGMHARPAALLVTTANQFPCEVWLTKSGVSVNAKSVMGLLMLAAARGTRMVVRCEGDRAADAVAAIQALFADGFGEMEL